MKPINFNENYYSLCEVKGKPFLFSDIRVSRDSIPAEFPVVYDLREGEGGFDPCQARPFILVNYFGTIIGCEELPLDGDNDCFLEEGDFNLLDNVTPLEFLNFERRRAYERRN